MPGRTKKVRLHGSSVDAEVIPVNNESEHWNTYLLNDGTVIRMKLITQEVVRVIDQYDKEGNPVYIIKSTNITHVDSPEELRKSDFTDTNSETNEQGS